MFKRAIILSIFLFTVMGLFALTYDWGIKYGAGLSSICGKDLRYNLHYDITAIDSLTSDFGYLDLNSNKARSGISQNCGLYFNTTLLKRVDSISMQAEVLWHRYEYSYNFKNKALTTNNIMLSTEFADTLRGSINQTIDYITVPVLIKLNQGLESDYPDKNYNGAYVYFGPSFSIKLDNKTTEHKGIKALDDNVDAFILKSYNDANETQVLASNKRTSASEKVISQKIDFVFGMGFKLKDLFEMGFGKDEFFIDCRFDFGINPIGDAYNYKDIKLYSTILSLGCRI